MRVTAILNLKGGVGKTTTAAYLAAMLATQYSARVLLIDCDSQHNLTDFWEADPERGNLADLLVNGRPVDASRLPQATKMPGVAIIPSSARLMGLDVTAITTGKANVNALQDMLSADWAAAAYDYVFLDCPPAFNAASTAALRAANDVLVPIKLDAFSLSGMANVMEQVYNMQAINPFLTVAGLIPTMFYRSDRSEQSLRILRNSGFHVLQPVRYTRKVDEATYSRVLLRNSHNGCEIDYKRLARQYAKGVF